MEVLRAARTDLARDDAVVELICPRLGSSLRVLELGGGGA